MAEKEDEGGKKKGGAWVKAVLGALGGMLSGAVVMYLTAWFDQAIKPAKPVPNFRVEHEGCTVHFQNLSPGFEGWWDFGDGTELVPASGGKDSVTHKYERPGDYTIKLSLKNLLGEENERTVQLHIDEQPAAKEPKVLALKAERVSPGAYAPAMYHITAKTENAPLCLWDLGDASPLQAVTDATATQEKWVTFDKPGDYTVELVAVNGSLTTYKTEIVSIQDAPAGSVGVVLTAADAGTSVQTRTQPCTFSDTFRPDAKGDVCPLSGRDLFAASSMDRDKGWVVRDVQLTAANGQKLSLGTQTELPLDAAAVGCPAARNLRLQLGPDRRSVRLLGELVRGPAKTPPPALVVQGVMTAELRKPESRTVPMPATLMVPAAGRTTAAVVTLPPVPADWVDVQPRKLSLTLRDGLSAPQEVQVPCRVELTLQKRRCILTATPVKDKDNKDQVRLELADAAGRLTAN